MQKKYLILNGYTTFTKNICHSADKIVSYLGIGTICTPNRANKVFKSCFAFGSEVFLGLHDCRRGNRLKTNMSTLGDVYVRICGQEIIKYDLEIKALIQVRL